MYLNNDGLNLDSVIAFVVLTVNHLKHLMFQKFQPNSNNNKTEIAYNLLGDNVQGACLANNSSK